MIFSIPVRSKRNFRLLYNCYYNTNLLWYGLNLKRILFSSGFRSYNKIKKLNKLYVRLADRENPSFGFDIKLYVPPLMYKIITHNICSVRS